MNCRKVELAEVTVSIAWCDNLRQPYVRMYSLTLGGQWICRIECEHEIDEARLVINSRHHVFWRVDDCPGVACILEDSDDEFPGLAPEFPETTRVTEDDSAVLRLLALAKDLNLLPIRIEDGVGEIRLPASNALPSWHASSISLPFSFDAVLDYLWPPGKDRTEPFEMPAIPECGVRSVTFTHDSTTYVRQRLNLLATKLDAVLTEIVIGPCRRAYEAFQKFRYVGPLRETPARTYLPPRYPDPSRWACGLGAWDELHTGSPELVQAVSRWLGDTDRLDAGYRVQRKEIKEVDLNDPIVADFFDWETTGRDIPEGASTTKSIANSGSAHYSPERAHCRLESPRRRRRHFAGDSGGRDRVGGSRAFGCHRAARTAPPSKAAGQPGGPVHRGGSRRTETDRNPRNPQRTPVAAAAAADSRNLGRDSARRVSVAKTRPARRRLCGIRGWQRPRHTVARDRGWRLCGQLARGVFRRAAKELF